MGKRRAFCQQYTSERFPGDSHRDHAKWIHYNLADVDEDAGLGGQANLKIAADLMRLLRHRRLGKVGCACTLAPGGLLTSSIFIGSINLLFFFKESVQNEDPSSDNPLPARILFRPTTGRKKRCLDSTSESSDATLSSRFSPEAELEGDGDVHGEVEALNHPEAVHFRPRRRAERPSRCITALDDHSDEEIGASGKESTSMTNAEGEYDTSSYESELTDLEDAPEGL